MELHKLHVLQWQACALDHGIAITGAGMGRSCREIGTPVAAGSQNDHLRAETMQLAGGQIPGHDALAGTVFIHQQIECEVLDEELRLALQALLIKRMQHGVTGAVGCRAGTLRRRTFTELSGHATKGALIDLAFLGAGERHAVVLKFDDRGNRFAGHVLNGVLITQPVGALDRVVEVPAPVVLAHVGKRTGDTALRRNGVRTGWKDLGDIGCLQT